MLVFSMDKLIQMQVKELQTRPDDGYNNHFIAMCGSQQAGFFQIQFHGEKWAALSPCSLFTK